MLRILFTLLCSVLVSTYAEERVNLERSVEEFTSSAWIQERGIHPTDFITCTFMMKLNAVNMNILENNAIDVSTPSSESYGKFLSNNKISQLISPSPANIQVVLDYLAKFGVSSESFDGSSVAVNSLRTMIKVRMHGDVAEQVFKTQFVQYRSVYERDVEIFRVARPYSLPESVAKVVAYVDDILRFPSVSKPLLTYGRRDSGISDEDLSSTMNKGYRTDNPFLKCGNDCFGYTTPASLEMTYHFPPVTVVDPRYTGTCIVSFEHRHYDSNNGDRFLDMCEVGDKYSGKVNHVIGGGMAQSCSLGGCIATTMQVEYARTVTGDIPLILFYDDNYSLARWLNWLLESNDPPLVHILSYTNQDTSQNSPEYREYINYHLAMAAARGFTVLYSSGDEGVWGKNGVMGQDYNPSFPSDSPWVTSVGGSNIKPSGINNVDLGLNGPVEETTWECSGGGFSDYFPLPSYQHDTVREYLGQATYENKLPPKKFYNATGRGFPDLVAIGGEKNPYCVVVRGGKGSIGVSSTTAAVTVVGSMFSDINHERIHKGKPALGFLNPLLYSESVRGCYNDIKDDSQNHCHVGSVGFRAIKGWDAASGFGSLKYACMHDLLVQ